MPSVHTRTPLELQTWLADVTARVNALMEERLTEAADRVPSRLQEAMRYACLGGGKRLRPALVCAAAQAVLGESRLPTSTAVWHAAVAIEMIHAFSLVHDDLPAMDDDDLRRGRPTLHRAYDEATAILVGDALTVRAFEMIVEPSIPAHLGRAMMHEIAQNIGWAGVIAGQYLDLHTNGDALTPEIVHRIHLQKTAALMRTSCRCGALAVGGERAAVERLGRVGELLGLAFQAIDDWLDEVADEQQIGKRTHKDRAAGKPTLPSVIGCAATFATAERYVEEAVELLASFGPGAEPLRLLARRVVERKS